MLGFQIEDSLREDVASWSEAYMSTVAQQRVRWMSFLGSNAASVLDSSMRQKIKLLMRLGQHTSVYFNTRQHTSAYVRICQHMSAYSKR